MQELKIGLGWKLDRMNAGIQVIKARFRKLNRDLKQSAAKVGEGYQGIFAGGALAAGGGFAAFQLGDQLAEHARGFEKLQTVTKTTDADMGKLRHAVYDLNQALGLKSTAEAQESLLETARLSGLTGESLKRLTFQTGLMNKQFGEDGNTLQAQINLMRAFKVSTREAGDVVGFLKKQGGDLRGELTEGISEYAVQFAEAGFSIEQTSAILKTGLGQGFSLDKAADAFKEGRLRLMGNEKASIDALKMLGLDNLNDHIQKGVVSVPKAFQQVQAALGKLGEAERFAVGKEIFGAPFEDAGAEAIDAMIGAMGVEIQTSGSIDLMANNLQNKFSYKWDKAISTSQNAFFKMLDSLKAYLLPVIDWFGKASTEVSKFVKTYKNITAAVGISILAFAGLTVALGFFKIAAGIGKTGFGLLGGALKLLFSPLGLIILGLVALGIGLYYLEQKTGLLSFAWEGLKNMWEGVWSVIEPSWQELKQLGAELWDGLIGLLKDFGLEIGESMTFSEQWGVIFQGVGKNIGYVLELIILAPLKSVMDMLINIGPVIEAFGEMWEAGFSIRSVVKFGKALTEWLIIPFEHLANTVIGQLVIGKLKALWEWAVAVFTSFKEMVIDLKNVLVDAFMKPFKAIGKFLKPFQSEADDSFTDYLGNSDTQSVAQAEEALQARAAHKGQTSNVLPLRPPKEPQLVVNGDIYTHSRDMKTEVKHLSRQAR